MTLKVKGLVNGTPKDSIFDINPRGWFEVTVEINSPYKEDCLEEAFKTAASRKVAFMAVAQVKEVSLLQ